MTEGAIASTTATVRGGAATLATPPASENEKNDVSCGDDSRSLADNAVTLEKPLATEEAPKCEDVGNVTTVTTKKEAEQTSSFGDGQVRKDDKFSILQQWLFDNGAHFPLLEVRSYDASPSPQKNQYEYDDFQDDEKKESTAEEKQEEIVYEDEGERGIHTKCDIDKHKVVVEIPRHCIVSEHLGEELEIGKKLKSSPDMATGSNKLLMVILYMLWDRNVNKEKAFFKPYYDTLPQTMNHLPIFWTEEELKDLTGSPLLEMVASRKEEIWNDYRKICETAPEVADFATFEDYQWCRCVVTSRNFALELEPDKKVNCMVPFGDMLNHQLNPRASKWTFDRDRSAFTITTLAPIDAGSQLTESYGVKNNHRWLLNYGFALEDNTETNGECANELPLYIDLNDYSDDPLFHEKLERFERPLPKPETPGRRRIPLKMGGNAVFRDVLGLLRLMVCNKEELDLVGSGGLEQYAPPRLPPFPLTMGVGRGGPRVAPPPRHPFGPGRFGSSGRGPPTFRPGGRGPPGRCPPPFGLGGGGSLPFGRFGPPPFGPGGRGPPPLGPDGGKSLPPKAPASKGCPSGPGVQGPASCGFGGRGPPLCPPRDRSATGGENEVKVRSVDLTGWRPSFRDMVIPVSSRNERAAMGRFLEILNKALAAYPSTLEQDELDLANEEEFPRFSKKRNAKIVVHGEKKIIHRHIHWCSVCLRVLDLLESELETASKGWGNEEEDAFAERLQKLKVVFAEEGVEELSGTEIGHFVKHCVEDLGVLRRREMYRLRQRLSATVKKGSK